MTGIDTEYGWRRLAAAVVRQAVKDATMASLNQRGAREARDSAMAFLGDEKVQDWFSILDIPVAVWSLPESHAVSGRAQH